MNELLSEPIIQTVNEPLTPAFLEAFNILISVATIQILSSQNCLTFGTSLDESSFREQVNISLCCYSACPAHACLESMRQGARATLIAHSYFVFAKA